MKGLLGTTAPKSENKRATNVQNGVQSTAQAKTTGQHCRPQFLQREEQEKAFDIEGLCKVGADDVLGSRSPLGFALCLRTFIPALFANPRMRHVSDLGEKEQIISAEGVGAFPFILLAVEAGERGVVTHTGVGFVPPEGSFDGAQLDFMDWFFVWHNFDSHFCHYRTMQCQTCTRGGRDSFLSKWGRSG